MRDWLRFTVVGVLAAALMLALGASPGMAQSRAHVYLLRGLMNIFSLGMDTLGAELNKRGVYATVDNHAEWQALADGAASRYKAGSEGPIILIGHSLGADAIMEMANYLGQKGVPVALVVPFDGTQSFYATSNVARVLNLTQRDYAYMRRGPGFHGSLVNVDLSGDPKIDHLTIVTPTTDRPVGLSAAEFATVEKKGEKGDKPKAKEAQADPLAPDPGAGEAAPAAPRKARGKKADDLFADDSSSGKPGKGRNSALKPPGTFTVRGTIKMSQNGLITIVAGRWAIKAKLDDGATIDVNMADIHFAQPDDQVTVSGTANPMRPNVVMAESIKVEMAKPLTGVKKHAAHSTKAKKDAPTADDLFGGKK